MRIENVGYEDDDEGVGNRYGGRSWDMGSGAGQTGYDQRQCECVMARVEVLMMGGRKIITAQPTFSEAHLHCIIRQ